MRLSLPAPDLSRQRLEAYRRMGVEALTVPRRLRTEFVATSPKLLVPAAATGDRSPRAALPDAAELNRIVARCHEFDLEPSSTGLGFSTAILSGPAAEQIGS